MFESINLVYKIMTPIAEQNRDWKKLINIHSKLLDAFTKMDQLEGKRIFGTYFRQVLIDYTLDAYRSTNRDRLPAGHSLVD